MTAERQQLGAKGESIAAEVLEAAGMVILERNWRCRVGELDLIALDEVEGVSTIVFCEVKYRTGTGFGGPLEAITPTKVRRLRRLAAEWLNAHQVTPAQIRLDAIGITKRPGYRAEVSHVTGIL